MSCAGPYLFCLYVVLHLHQRRFHRRQSQPLVGQDGSFGAEVFGFEACEGEMRWFKSGGAGFGCRLGRFGWFGCFHGPSCRCKFPYCKFNGFFFKLQYFELANCRTPSVFRF